MYHLYHAYFCKGNYAWALQVEGNPPLRAVLLFSQLSICGEELFEEGSQRRKHHFQEILDVMRRISKVSVSKEELISCFGSVLKHLLIKTVCGEDRKYRTKNLLGYTQWALGCFDPKNQKNSSDLCRNLKTLDLHQEAALALAEMTVCKSISHRQRRQYGELDVVRTLEKVVCHDDGKLLELVSVAKDKIKGSDKYFDTAFVFQQTAGFMCCFTKLADKARANHR